VRRVRLDDLLASPEELSRFRDLLVHGGVAAIPTETFYGLAANPWSETGVARIFRIKGRDDGKPLSVLFSEPSHLVSLGIARDPATIETFLWIWPAPLTVVLPLSEIPAASRGAHALAVRMPADTAVLQLLSAVGPLTGTSANRSGRPALDDPNDVAEQLGAELDLLIDGGRTPGVQPSTLVDATQDPPVLLRAGAFPWPPGEPRAR
jgi:L-threonylcarbamoyladenylate synthase